MPSEVLVIIFIGMIVLGSYMPYTDKED